MANYNSKKYYNKRIISGGANYNSATYFIVRTSDSANSQELLNLSTNIVGTDSGTGEDALSLKQFPSNEFFVITEDSMLYPLGVTVLGDTKREIIAGTRDNAEEVPGRDGEIDFGTELKAKILEIPVATPEGLTSLQKKQFERMIAKYLNPLLGEKKLIYLDDDSIEYKVKYSGKIDPTNYPTWFQFTIPFKMCDPIIQGTSEKTLTGSGTIINEGTAEAPITIEITGPVTNPSVVIGDTTLTYTGTLTSSETLIIDTGLGTAKIGSTNALANMNEILEFPLLQPGNTTVTAASSGTTVFKWLDKWL
jgi:predicted phage tail component-like protein